MVETFNKTETLWENYAPEYIGKGERAKDAFVGWSGLFPISVMFEYVFGIRPFAREKKIVWYVNLTEEHGVKDYPLGDVTLDLVCRARASREEEPVIEFSATAPVTIEVHFGDRVKILKSE